MRYDPIFTEFFVIRFLINTLSMIVLIRFVYYSIYSKKEYYFTFFLLNLLVFLLAFMLEKTRAFNSLGSAFGLLAAFSLLRFRTESISTKDMTYLFIIISLGLINSVMKGTYVEIGALNVIIITAVYIVDGNKLIRNQKSKTIEYNNLENIRPAERSKLVAELSERTGLDIQKLSIEHIDFERKRVLIKIYYY